MTQARQASNPREQIYVESSLVKPDNPLAYPHMLYTKLDCHLELSNAGG